MPISFLVKNEQVSFLTFVVKEGENFCAHPAVDKHSAYLNPALFREYVLPEIETKSTQQDNVVIVQRNINNLSNSAVEILDE